MGHRFVGRLVVLVHTDHDPDPDEWQRFIDDANARVGSFRGFLIVTSGGSLDAAQRSDAIDLIKRSGASAAVITESAMVRGAVTAVSWFGGKAKAFPAAKLTDALEYAGVEQAARGNVLRVVRELTDTLKAEGAPSLAPPA